MEWLTWQAAAITAAAAVPSLVLLYFLKLNRREMPISSTLLWKRAVQDLQVNAPFQRLRRNLLLLLQLLALAAALLALAQPILSLRAGPGRRHVVLIDRSASMNATDGGADGATRLAEARRQAGILVDSLRGPSVLSLDARGDEAMIIAFDARAKVMCNFTSDRAQLRAALDAVEPTDGPSSLAEAITVARAFAQSPGEDASNRPAEQAAQLELFSDGRIADLEAVVVQPGEMNFHRVGGSPANLAVTAMQARRSYERADEVHVFATVSNAGKNVAECDVQLSLDGTVRAVRHVRVPARKAAEGDRPAGPGQVSVSFVLTHSATGVVEVRQLHADALPADDAAWAVLEPPRRLSVLLVSRGNAALQAALKACPLARLDAVSPAKFDEKGPSAGGADSYDVIVLDGHAPAKLPRGRYVVFGRPPADAEVKTGPPLKNQIIVDWRSRHPVLQFVNLGNLFVASASRLQVPRDASVLAEFGESPAMALVRRRGSAFLLVSFDVLETNWPFQAGFVMFCYNATSFLGLEAGQERDATLRVGQAITLRADGQKQATVTAPDGRRERVSADPSGSFRYPRTLRAGVYTVEVESRPPARYAANILDEAESDIESADELVLTADTIQAAAAPRRTSREIWPYLALAVLLLVCIEWLVYNSKVRL